jgi:hypothetical protein
VRYGLNKQDGIELRKTEDVLQFNSALGYRKTHSLTGTTPQNSISIPNSQMDMLTQIQKFPSKRFARLYFLRTWSGICHKDKQKLLYISLYIQNNNGTGPETQPRCFWC